MSSRDVGRGLAGDSPKAMKAAQVLQRMWIQAVKKLGILKGHVSLSASSLPLFFPNLSFQEGVGGGQQCASHGDLPPLSVTNCERQTVVGGGLFNSWSYF